MPQRDLSLSPGLEKFSSMCIADINRPSAPVRVAIDSQIQGDKLSQLVRPFGSAAIAPSLIVACFPFAAQIEKKIAAFPPPLATIRRA
jgi:hypothetical protein